MTANRIVCLSKTFAAAERPIRPLYLRHACSAMATSLPAGHQGKSSRTRDAKRSTYSRSNCARRTASRSLRRALASLSAKHSLSAFSRALASSSKPCRSYCFRARLHFKTTATKLEYLRARLVSAPSPEGRKARWSRSAHAKQSAPVSLVKVIQARQPRSSPHSSQEESLLEMNTFMSVLRFPSTICS